MKYKSEVIVNNQVRVNYYFEKLSNPNQVVRNTIEKLNGHIKYFVVLVLNDKGEVWKYTVVKQVDGRFRVRKTQRATNVLNKDQIDLIYTGNETILKSV